MTQANYQVMRQDEDVFSDDYPECQQEQATPEADFAYLLKVANDILYRGGLTDHNRKRLATAAERCDPWLETDDPRANGWVDDRGRP